MFYVANKKNIAESFYTDSPSQMSILPSFPVAVQEKRETQLLDSWQLLILKSQRRGGWGERYHMLPRACQSVVQRYADTKCLLYITHLVRIYVPPSFISLLSSSSLLVSMGHIKHFYNTFYNFPAFIPYGL